LTEKSAPVVKPASSVVSQPTIEAISSALPRRLTGIVWMIFSRTVLANRHHHVGGDDRAKTVLTVMPLLATSRASDIVKPCMPALAAE